MYIKSILLVLFNTLYQINCIQPHASSMGTQLSDKINKTGNSMSGFLFQISYNMIVAIVCIMDLIYNGNENVSFFEWILFCLTILGTVIRFRAYYDLGNLFTFDIGTRENHILIRTGIYKYIRHPGYAGGFLILIPMWIFTNVNILITLVLILYTIHMYWSRIKHEEDMLIKYFGVEYVNYSCVTKSLIPCVL